MALREAVDKSPRAAGEGNGVRADIIEAATRVFSERGYHAASMTEIAAEVGIQKPSLYHHVRKKEDLLFAIHEQLIDELTEETLAVISTAMTPSEKLTAVLHASMRFIAHRRDAVTVFLSERQVVTGDRWTELVVKRDFYEQLVNGIIADGTKSKAFIDLPAPIAARGVLAMTNWCYTWFDPEGQLGADAVADVFATLALRGLEVR
jgi:TetR/AcrR family transcriptional regulator, cholesterol catabolism regulator